MVITILEVVKRLIQMLWDLNLTQLEDRFHCVSLAKCLAFLSIHYLIFFSLAFSQFPLLIEGRILTLAARTSELPCRGFQRSTAHDILQGDFSRY